MNTTTAGRTPRQTSALGTQQGPSCLPRSCSGGLSVKCIHNVQYEDHNVRTNQVQNEYNFILQQQTAT